MTSSLLPFAYYKNMNISKTKKDIPIYADILMAFAGEFFNEEIEDTGSL